ncbi:MAG: FAD-dependent oxidoreductase [Planctomycetota bacterium]|nr:FAD-dependent oxidoreductase [Planctomycetota bacterium]
MNGSSRRILVVGGGVIGAACSHQLANRGYQVTVIEKDLWGRACSHGNCGLICPSHVLPLTEPGAVRKTMFSLLKRNSPFSIRPRFDPRLWKWLWRFARRCRHDRMVEAARTRMPLLEQSQDAYRQMVQEGILECEWESRGSLYVYRDQEQLDKFSATASLLEQEFGLLPECLDGDQLEAMEPTLKSGLAGAWYFPDDVHVRPDRLLSSWRTHLEKQGVQIHENCELEKLVCEQGRVVAAIAGEQQIELDGLVIATGALTPLLARELGCRLPIQPGKGYSITMPRPQPCPTIPLLFVDEKVVATPMQSGYRLGSMMELNGYDTRIKPRRLKLLRKAAEKYLHEPHADPVEEEWYGWRPMTSDGVPFIDRLPGLENAWVAAGHNMLGLSMAPATGQLVAELVDGVKPSIDPAPYRIDRG